MKLHTIYDGCVRLASPGRPRSAPGTFEKLWRQPPSALLVERVTWGWPQVHDVTTRGWVVVSISSFVRGSPEWAPQGRHREANRTHTIYKVHYNLFVHPDCQDLLDAGYKEDGIYTIHPFQNDEGMKVFCDMTKNTGWIVSTCKFIFGLQ